MASIAKREFGRGVARWLTRRRSRLVPARRQCSRHSDGIGRYETESSKMDRNCGSTAARDVLPLQSFKLSDLESGRPIYRAPAL